jgi:hypothetical protein
MWSSSIYEDEDTESSVELKFATAGVIVSQGLRDGVVHGGDEDLLTH